MPHEEIREQNIEKVLNTAHELFLRLGIDNTTQAMIAQECGLSLRTVNRCFASKEQMVILVAKHVLDAAKNRSNEVPTDLRALGKSGIELLEMYFSFVKDGYLINPSVGIVKKCAVERHPKLFMIQERQLQATNAVAAFSA